MRLFLITLFNFLFFVLIFFLQVLIDNPKSRREVELHYRACPHPYIVNIKDLYENIYNGNRSLLVVMER